MTKRVKSSFGETEISVPRDSEGSFNPMLVKKRQNTIDSIENIIISLYAKGMSVSDIEEQICQIYNFELSVSYRYLNYYNCLNYNSYKGKKIVKYLFIANY